MLNARRGSPAEGERTAKKNARDDFNIEFEVGRSMGCIGISSRP